MKQLLAISFLFSFVGFTQTNLVINPDFEDGERTPNGVKEIRNAGYLLPNWYSPLNKRSPHYFVEPKKSVAKAQSGTGAVGLVLGGGRQEKTKLEYLTGELKSPLKKGQAYCVCFHSLLHRTSRWAATDAGVFFHHDKELIKQIEPQNYKASLYMDGGDPIINTKWKKYCGYYIASGGEKFLSIGKFGKSKSLRISDLDMEAYFELDAFQSKAYYQFDNFSVLESNDSTDCHCATKLPEVVKDSIQETIQPYLFALDVSGSMKTGALFDSLRHNLRNLLARLPNGTHASFATFSSSSKMLFTGKLSDATRLRVDSLLANVQLGGGTNVLSGLSEAYGSLKVNGLDSARMVLISDGAFTITTKIEELVKAQYETHGRRLTIVQIEKEIKKIERLDPYQVSYIPTTPSELSHAISQLYRTNGSSETAIGCECSEIFSDTMNYHFVVDYSGSMKHEKSRAINSLKYLFEKAPEDAVISITAFANSAKEIYVGKKSGITIEELSRLLEANGTGGGTSPAPGVRRALITARRMALNRFSHLILITDLSANQLSRIEDLSSALASAGDMYLATSAMTVDSKGVLLTHAQYDMANKEFLDVTQEKFETDLFYTERSSCDFTSQQYHFNPVKDALKKEAKKTARQIWKELMKQGGVRIPQ